MFEFPFYNFSLHFEIIKLIDWDIILQMIEIHTEITNDLKTKKIIQCFQILIASIYIFPKFIVHSFNLKLMYIFFL